MATAKGLAVLGASAALAAGSILTAIAATPPSTPAWPDVREKILQLLEGGALYRDRINWPDARQQLQHASGPAEADKILDQLIARSTGNHGLWIRASAMASPSGRMERIASAGQLQRPHAESAAASRKRESTEATDPIGWVAIPTFKENSTAPSTVREQQQLTFALQLQSQLQMEDAQDRCGWIVDLRQNQGGNMWPMLLGLAPLLAKNPNGKEVIGAFHLGATHQAWSLQPGRVLIENRTRLELSSPPYVLRRPAPPVAVLIGHRTASSGEMVTLAFRGRPTARSFGQETAGFSTANTPVPLPDGSVLLLTGSVAVDRNHKGDGGKLQPDVSVSNEADAEHSARNWLLTQPQCRAMASNR